MFKNETKALLERARKEWFTEDAKVTETEVLGVLVSKVCDWNGYLITDVAKAAYEDSNFHAASGGIEEWFSELYTE